MSEMSEPSPTPRCEHGVINPSIACPACGTTIRVPRPVVRVVRCEEGPKEGRTER